MKKTVIHVYSPDPGDACSFYRAVTPLHHLARMDDRIEVKLINHSHGFSWHELEACDILFMNRVVSSDYLKVVMRAKDYGKKVWLDYDDNFLEVPLSNRAHDFFANEQNRENLFKMLSIADAVSVSTFELRQVYLQTSNKITVIPNAIDVSKFKYADTVLIPKRSVITWRGSSTHDKDLHEFTASMVDVSKNNPDWAWNFFGKPYWYTIENLLKANAMITKTEFSDITAYMYSLYQARSAIHIVPLHDCGLNRSKSNIAWIEATLAGACVLAPDWLTWIYPGVTTYRDPEDFKLKLTKLIESKQLERSELNMKSRQYIMENLTLDKVNEQRRQIVEGLMYG